MKLYKKIMSVIAAVEKVVLSAVLVLVTVITFANVVVRKLTSSQFAWSEELVINLFVLLIMLGCALAAQEGSLISLSLIYDRLHIGAKKVFVTIITLQWPEWVFTIFLPIGAIFLVLHTIEFFIDNVFGGGLTAGEEAQDD